jgi:archaeoflavoprotein AfpA
MKNELKHRVAWGITGSGDQIREILETMKDNQEKHAVDIRVFVSKAGEQVLQWYKLLDDLKENFKRVYIETTPNTPFLAGELQAGRYDFFIIAPTSSNTTAKISLGLGDSLISNATSMASKAYVPVYVLPCEYGFGTTNTKLPDGRDLNLRIRKEDTAHINKLEQMDDIHVIKAPSEITETFRSHYSQVH